jgi:hypothetical protein
VTAGEERAASGSDAEATLPLTVSASVGRRFFHDRLTDQYAHHYHLIVSIFKGVALGSAAVSFLAIVGSAEPAQAKVTALALWVTSLAAIIATYDGIMITSILSNAPPNTVDLVAPFVMGLAEFMQFAVLTPLAADPVRGEPSAAAQLDHLTWWPLVFAVLTLTAAVDIANAKAQMRRTLHLAPRELQPLIHWYVGSLRQSQISIGICSAAMVVAFVALHFGPDRLGRWQAVVAGVTFVGMVNGILSSERARHRIVSSVDAVIRHPVTKAE